MNKKASTVIITALCFLVTTTIIILYLIKTGAISTKNIFTSGGTRTTGTPLPASNSTAGSRTASEQKYGYPVYAVLLKEGAHFTIQFADSKSAINEFSDMYIKFNSLKITKERGDFDKCDDMQEVKDSAGNITNNYFYAVCNVTLINKGKRDVSEGLNCLSLRLTDRSWAPASAFNSGKKPPYLPDYFDVTFEAGKEYNYNLAFILSDAEIKQYKDNLLLYAGFAYTKNKKIPVIQK